jgi:glycosyltransferase involved in cell wall biosynthesis
MRILHVVKTSYGAKFAARQARVLSELGCEIHVAVPSPQGEAIPLWETANARIHVIECSFSARSPQEWRRRAAEIRSLVQFVQPDLIHSHFVTNTLALRIALGRSHHIPRLYQVAGPLHMEHMPSRMADLRTAGRSDYWIASSHNILRLYREANVPHSRLYMSYYGRLIDDFAIIAPTNQIRQTLGIPEHHRIIGNIAYFYPPKYMLGHTTGIKGHEVLIDAIGLVCAEEPDITAVFVGGQPGGPGRYERSLRKRASDKAGDHIKFMGVVHHNQVKTLCAEFSVAAHVPNSENAGGTVEPLANMVPTVGSTTGAIPEVVIDGETGWLVPPRSPELTAQAILSALRNPDEAHRRATNGHWLVKTMLNIERTAAEVADIYRHVLAPTGERPEPVCSRDFLPSS